VRDAIGLVIEFLREKLIEVLKRVGLKDVGVNLGDAVHAEAGVNGLIRHMDLAILDDLHLITLIGIDALFRHIGVKAAIDFFNYHIDTRQESLNVLDGPAFKSFWHNGVVGVSDALIDLSPGFIPAIAIFVHEQTHHFRNGENRMGVIQLENVIIAEFVERAISSHMAAHGAL